MTTRLRLWSSPRHPAWLELSAGCAGIARRAGARTDLVVRVHPGETMSVPGQPPAWYDSASAELRIDAGRVLAPGVDDPRRVDLASAAGRARHPILVGVVLQLAARAAHSDPSIRLEADPWSGALEAARAFSDCSSRTRRPRASSFGRPVDTRFRCAAGWGDGRRASVAPRGDARARTRRCWGACRGRRRRAAPRPDGTAGKRSGSAGGGPRSSSRCAGRSLAGRSRHHRPGAGSAAGHAGPGAATDAMKSAAAALGAAAADAFVSLHAASEGPTPAPRDPVTAARRHHAQNAHRTAYRHAGSEIDGTVHRDPSEPLRRRRPARWHARSVPPFTHPPPPKCAPRRCRQDGCGSPRQCEPSPSTPVRSPSRPSRGGIAPHRAPGPLSQGRAQLGRLAVALERARACLRGGVGTRLGVAHRRRVLQCSRVELCSQPVVWPSRVPTTVAYPPCHGASSGCAQSLRALDGALGLSESVGTRVVVVVSDGALPTGAMSRRKWPS